jgi:hypothetical protein
MRCADDALQAYVSVTLYSVAGWEPLVAATSDPEDAVFSYGLDGSNSPIAPYAHYVDDILQDGVYLGVDGTTTWAFKFDQSGQYYFIRLAGPDSGELQDGEFDGFLKVNA